MEIPHYNETDTPNYESMKVAGQIAAETHEYLESLIDVGRSTAELDRAAEEFIREQGGEPAFEEYSDSTYTITVSINDQLIHTSPYPGTELEAGDLVSIDLGVKYEGHYSDTARTISVGNPRTDDHEALLERTKSALYAGILQATAGNTLVDVGQAIEDKSGPFGNVTDWAGHFIGRRLHLRPQVYNTAAHNNPVQLESGMYLAIEPILVLTDEAGTLERSPGGTVRSKSGAPGAHFEHTIRVGRDRAELVTGRADEPDRL